MNTDAIGSKDAGEIHPTRRVKIYWALIQLLVFVLGYVANVYGWPFIRKWFDQQNEIDPSGAPLRIALALFIILASAIVFSLGVAAYLWSWAYRIFRAKKFPPEGFIILAPTKIAYGQAAVKKAVLYFLTGVLVIAFDIYIIYCVFSIFPQITEMLRPLWALFPF